MITRRSFAAGTAAQFLMNHRMLEHAPQSGYTTPSLLMGARCVEQLPGSTAIRMD